MKLKLIKAYFDMVEYNDSKKGRYLIMREDGNVYLSKGSYWQKTNEPTIIKYVQEQYLEDTRKRRI